MGQVRSLFQLFIWLISIQAQVIPEVTAPEDESLGFDETGSGSLGKIQYKVPGKKANAS
jgi:hypothetical protein